MRKLKALVVADHAKGISGPHRNVVGSLNALSNRSDVDVRLLCGAYDLDEPYAGRVDICSGFRPHEKRRLVENARRMREAAMGCDVVYVPTGLKSFLYAWAFRGAAKLVAGPNVTGIPGLMNMHNPTPLMTTRMSSRWIEMSDVRLKAAMRAGTRREDIDLIPRSVDTEKFHPRHADPSVWDTYGIPKCALKIAFAGHINVERKGAKHLIAGFEKIRESFPEAHLVMLGRGADTISQTEGVVFTGFLTGADYVRHLASADIFIGASRWETFWFTPLEAMACGVPVIVSPVGAVPMMIPEPGVQGVLVDIVEDGHYRPDAADRLAAAAIPLLRDAGARRKIGSSGRAHVERQFSEKLLGERLVMSFRKALDHSFELSNVEERNQIE